MRLIPRVCRLPQVLLFVMTLLIVMAPAKAGAILPSIGLYGGRTEPLGRAGVSWAARGVLYFGLAPFLSLGPEVGLYDFDEKLDSQPQGCMTCPSSDSRVTTYGGVLRVGVPLAEVHPYLIAGLGYYRWKYYDYSPDPYRGFLGMSGGGGLDLGSRTNFVNLAFEARWHGKFTLNPTWRGARNLFTVMTGLRLHLF